MTEREENIIKRVFDEHDRACEHKSTVGDKGIFEQTRLNERFYAGDQWHGANVSAKRPLVRHNLIKRIGEYKQAVVSSGKKKIIFSAEGAVVNDEIRKSAKEMLYNAMTGDLSGYGDEVKTELNAMALGGHFEVCANRTGLEDELMKALKNAYISGTGALYVYWDNSVRTGLFADELKTTPVMGDVCCKTVDIQNIDFGDPNVREVENQPYIIIAERRRVDELKNEAKMYGVSDSDIERIMPDYCFDYSAVSEDEPYFSKKVTVLTKIYKCFDDEGNVSVKAVSVCRGCVVRPEWDMRIRRYPISIFRWDERSNSVYGESEIGYIIPNQTAINRMLTASVWATMLNGMPMMMVNRSVIRTPVTNEPGQIISFYGELEEFANAVKYVQPPEFAENFRESIESMIDDTLDLCGAPRAALGSYEANNASAIESLQKAAKTPLGIMADKYWRFVCETALIFAEFFVCCYGKRKLKVKDGEDIIYLPFDSEKCKGLVLIAEAVTDNGGKNGNDDSEESVVK